MKKLFALGMAGTLVALATAAFAYPTFLGQTGIVATPTAAVAPAGQLNVAADYYNTDEDSTFPVRALYGVGSNLELGAAFISSTEDTWAINAKYALPFDLAGFGLAAGALYATTSLDPDDLKTTQIYLAGSRALIEGDGTMPAINGTLGVNWTKMEAGAADADAFRFFLNAEAAFANNITVAAEYQTKDSDLDSDPISSIVVRYPFTSALTAQAGFTNAFLTSGTDDHNFFVGANYAFGAY